MNLSAAGVIGMPDVCNVLMLVVNRPWTGGYGRVTSCLFGYLVTYI